MINNNNNLQKLLFFLLGLLIMFNSIEAFSQASCLCLNNQMNATPFCTDQNPYGVTYTAGTSGYANELYYLNSTGCLDRYSGAPNPVWYKMRISVPGELIIYMSHSGGGDIDYACWGPFTDQDMNNMCSNYTNNPSSLANYLYDNLGGYYYCQNYSHNPNYSSWAYDWYATPSGRLVDCSSTPYASEYVHIHNAQVGEWYILLISNWGGRTGTINFARQASSTAATDCTITAPITGDEVCEGDTATITAMAMSGAIYYNWSGPNGFTQTTTNNTLTIPNISIAQAGEYSVQVWNGSSYGNTTQCDVIVHPNPTLTLAQTATICKGDSITLSVRGAETYVWNTANTDSNYVVSPDTTTAYQVTGTTFGMCTGTASTTVIVYPTYDNHYYDTICQRTGYNRYGFTLTAAETDTPGDQELNFVYQSLNQCDSSVTVHLTIHPHSSATIDTAICEGETLIIANQQYTETGTYTQAHQNQFGCDSTLTIHLTVNPVYHLQATVSVCENDLPYYYPEADTTFDVGTTTNNFLFSTPTNNGCDSTLSLQLNVYPPHDTEEELQLCHSNLPYYYRPLNVTFEATIPNDTTCYFALTSAHNCDSNVTLHVTVFPDELELVSLTEDFCEENTATLQATSTLPNFVWSTGEITSQIVITRPGSYTVTATDGICRQTRRIFIPGCELNIFLPTAITPSLDDGMNDYFAISESIATQLSDFDIFIYDRWGKVVFHSQDPFFKWYGYSASSKLLVDNTLVYVITYKDPSGNRQIKRGSITVL